MKIEKLNENKLKITLSLDDLVERNIDLQSFIYNSPESQDLFWDMMNEAEREYGFDVNESMIYVEASSNGAGFTLIVTKTDDPTIVHHARQKVAGKKKTFKLKRKNIKNNPTKALYIFDKFDDLCDFCEVININDVGENSLYKLDNAYYLQLDETTNLANILDFANVAKNMDISIGRINEYGNIVLEKTALQEIRKYFVKRKITKKK